MLKKYLIESFFGSFFTLFAILFIIASMVLLLTISNMTAMLKINLSEFLYLYVLSLPEIIFYTLPLTFFITASLSIAKLFENSELITVLALGSSPKQIVKPFFNLSIFLTFLLFIITFLSIPTSQILYKNFINIKKAQSQFNFFASSIGQKFGNWNVFIKEKHNNNYKDLILYNNSQKLFIISNTAETLRNKNYFTLSLFDGNLYYQDKNTTTKVKFKQLDLNQQIQILPLNLQTIGDYLKKYKYKTNKYLLIALFPIVSMFFLAGVSFFHNRYQKNHSVILSLSIAVLYYVSVFISYKNLYAIFIIIPAFLLLSMVFRQRIKQF